MGTSQFSACRYFLVICGNVHSHVECLRRTHESVSYEITALTAYAHCTLGPFLPAPWSLTALNGGVSVTWIKLVVCHFVEGTDGPFQPPPPLHQSRCAGLNLSNSTAGHQGSDLHFLCSILLVPMSVYHLQIILCCLNLYFLANDVCASFRSSLGLEWMSVCVSAFPPLCSPGGHESL